jgi:hypothetical protein
MSTTVSGVSRQLAQLVQRLDYGILRHVVHDLDFADFLWQDEVHRSVASFFVCLQTLDNITAANFNSWQRT